MGSVNPGIDGMSGGSEMPCGSGSGSASAIGEAEAWVAR